eukprot:gnl/Dysnectes_brevis/1395_a1571_2906.p1 GENE.gnl/Dysnectes_brevis/1395_a1571_2906~~gnl/Dysnectes_brevis/1395_a1571_2906.p1  ORF type:complete len:552 (+),score=223.61 gnl/Dysnectes_brevis/1395_a1571_2906:37-1692(+)
MSVFEVYRRKYEPEVPELLKGVSFDVAEAGKTEPISDADAIRQLFPKTYGLPLLTLKGKEGEVVPAMKVGVIFSGGQAPGGHNVLCGLYDKLMMVAPGSTLIGFLGGPAGLMYDRSSELTAEFLAPFRNMGGFHAIGSGRDKIHSPEQFEAAASTAEKHNLDGLVIIGGDDSNTNACLLGEFFKHKGLKTSVVGVPKTIDRDLLSKKGIETSFGFDSASKVYAALIGNLCFDALSAKKYWHFIRLMGRSASHITLECALQCHPNIAIYGEEVKAKNMTVKEVVNMVTDGVVARARQGKNYGICLIPEGLIEFIPEIAKLVDFLNNKLLPSWPEELEVTPGNASERLPADLKVTFESLPALIRSQLLLDRDPHGNVAVSKIETEKFIVAGVKDELKRRMAADAALKVKFSTQCHFFGYEGRCCPPSNFDCCYCYGLGSVAAVLLSKGCNGYMASLRGLAEDISLWEPIGLPLTSMMNMEWRHGHQVAVIQKQMVALDGRPFGVAVANREKWLMEDCYEQPGPIEHVHAIDAEGRAVANRPSACVLEESRGLM